MDYIGLVIFVVVVLIKFASENNKAQQQKEDRRRRQGEVPPGVPPIPSRYQPPVTLPSENPLSPRTVLYPDEPASASHPLSPQAVEYPDEPTLRPLTLGSAPAHPVVSAEMPAEQPVPRRFVVSAPTVPPPMNKLPPKLPELPRRSLPVAPAVPTGGSSGSSWGYLFDKASASPASPVVGYVADAEQSQPVVREQLTGLNRDAIGESGTLKRVRRASCLGNRADLRRAVLLSEILGRPKGVDGRNSLDCR